MLLTFFLACGYCGYGLERVPRRGRLPVGEGPTEQLEIRFSS